jgi:phosphoglycerol transferase MdoB-like AlkP superfamily enzyme
MIGTGIAGLRGRMPGCEPEPYILRFDEDRPNPLYRRVCYTFAWNAAINFALLNLIGTALAAFTGTWYLKQIYYYAYAPICAVILLLGILGKLPRVGFSTKGEGRERRYFYGTVWAASVGQTVLLILWKSLPRTQEANMVKLIGYILTLAFMAFLAANGKLHRTKPILPGDVIAD